MTGIQIAALVMVSVGSVGLLAIFAFMRRRMEQLRNLKERE
jgi:hypothetical protein